ncbi:DNA-binding transcriptional regulator LsrR (DeoR family) [Microbacterium sp. W4I4]|uniref:sugar-binding transcriptional regulator n=1 Tax=Microbacterium sp. W4I4 TaxID=3042295 RepID=UPI00278AD5FB|nr:sugar-binding domain-containing protein [Microbacterium sp. W4I4]MDQ0613940.1 DNA-binding transcriptional regulator LsrR (DeoR family) [Microbacterium sp. W4I4]
MPGAGPLSNIQLAHVAREHYVNGKSRVEISSETGLSRFKIGRMLDEARERGIIRFEIVSTPGIDLDLSMRLKRRYGLEHAVAVELPVDTDEAAQSALGAAAAGILHELIDHDGVLGLTSGRTLNVMARQLHEVPCRAVVQLAGVAGPIQESGLEVIRRLASFPGVQPWPIYASLVMSDAQTARGTLRQPGIRAAVEMFDEVTVALCAIGSWTPPNSLMMMNPAIDDEDRRRLLGLGAVAEIASTVITDTGEVIHDLDDRCIAVTETQLRAIPSRVAVAGGSSKTRAIRASLSSGLLTGLITDAFTAARLLAG